MSKLNRIYKCSFPNCKYGPETTKSFSKSKYLKQHEDKVHAEKIHICPTCQKGFGSYQLLASHIKACGQNFPCDSCHKHYISYEALLTHLKRNKHESKLQPLKRKPNVSPSQPIFIILPQLISNNPPDTSNDIVKPKHIAPILPKPSTMHFMAAMALSELAGSADHRSFPSFKSVIEVGTQTDSLFHPGKFRIPKQDKKMKQIKRPKVDATTSSSFLPLDDIEILNAATQTDRKHDRFRFDAIKVDEKHLTNHSCNSETQTKPFAGKCGEHIDMETQTALNRLCSAETQTSLTYPSEQPLVSLGRDNSKLYELNFALNRDQEENSMSNLAYLPLWDDMDDKATAATQTDTDPFLRQGVVEEAAGGVLLCTQTQTCTEEDFELFNAVNLCHMETQTNWTLDSEQNGGYVDTETQTALSAVWWRELGRESRGLCKQSSLEDTGTDPMEQ